MPAPVSCDNVDIWIKCPSTLPYPPVVTTTATLYIEQALLTKGDGTYAINGTPKWPDALGAPVLFKKLSVWPTRVIVDGYELRDGELNYGSVDLLDPDLALTVQNSTAAKPSQKLVLDGGAVTLSLTSAGFERFGVAFPISLLKQAVETIKEGTDAHNMANAWRTIATWTEMSKTKPSMLTAEARLLVSQVLKQPDR